MRWKRQSLSLRAVFAWGKRLVAHLVLALRVATEGGPLAGGGKERRLASSTRRKRLG